MTKNTLIIIDVQNHFMNNKIKILPQKIAKFIKKNKFNFVLFTKFVNKKSSNFFKILNWKECINSPDTDIHSAMDRGTMRFPGSHWEDTSWGFLPPSAFRQALSGPDSSRDRCRYRDRTTGARPRTRQSAPSQFRPLPAATGP